MAGPECATTTPLAWDPRKLHHPPLPPPKTDFRTPRDIRDKKTKRHAGNGYTRDQSGVLRIVFASMTDLLIVDTYLKSIKSEFSGMMNHTPLPNMVWVSGLEDVMPHVGEARKLQVEQATRHRKEATEGVVDMEDKCSPSSCSVGDKTQKLRTALWSVL